MRFLVSTAFSAPSHAVPLARAADECGYHYVGISDHVFFPEKLESQYPYKGSGTPGFEGAVPWLDPWVAAGAMASVTERVRFVTHVYQLPLRHPLQVAKSVGTASVLSGGRVSLGIGIGWMREEFDVLGQDFRTRGKRCDEAIEILRAVWAGGMVEYHGRHYDFPRLAVNPPPEQPIPILVGGVSDVALRRAARSGDGWISALHPFAELRELIEKLGRYREEAGRGHEPFEVLVACSDTGGLDGYRRLAEIGATAVQTMPWWYYGGKSDALSDKVDAVRRFADEIIQKL